MPGPVASYGLVVSREDGRFHLTAGGGDGDIAALVDEAEAGGFGVAGGGGTLVVLSPDRRRRGMPMALELWRTEPADDADAWEEVCEAAIAVNADGLRYHSPSEPTDLPPLPAGSFAVRVSGRGFSGRGWRGPVEPSEEWRVQLWPADGRPTRRLKPLARRRPAQDGPSPDVQELVAAVVAANEDLTLRPMLRAILQARASGDPSVAVRRMALAYFGNHATEAKDDAFVRACADADGDPTVRTTAVALLMSPWAEDPENLPWMQRVAVRDPEAEVRVAAVKAVAGGWPRFPATEAWLTDLARGAELADVRWAAVVALGAGWPGNGGVFPVLRGCAADDPDPDVRRAAVRAIAAGWARDPGARGWLRERAQADDHADAAVSALHAVVRGGGHEPGLGAWLRRQVTNPHREVRSAAVAAVADRAGADPEAVGWLRDRAEDAEHADVRRSAVDAIAGRWRGEPGVRAFLRRRAIEDVSEDVRWAALQASVDPAGEPSPEAGAWRAERVEAERVALAALLGRS